MMPLMLNRLTDFFHKAIGFLQETGILIMIFLSIIGLMLFLLSGNSPIIKRAGIVTSIVFGVGSLAAAYLPVLMYYITDDERKRQELLAVVAEDTAGSMNKAFEFMLDLAIPITITIIFLGLMVRGLGANNPKKKRKGVGLILSSSLVLLLIFILPKIANIL